MIKKKLLSAFIVTIFITSSFFLLPEEELGPKLTLFTQEREIYLKAYDLLRENKLPEAIKKLNNLIGRNVSKLDYPIILVSALFKLKHYEVSARICQNLFNSNKAYFRRLQFKGNKSTIVSQLYYIQAVSLLKMNANDKAIPIFKQIIRSNNYLKPRSSDTKGWVLFPKSRKSFYAAIHYNLGIAYLKSGDINAAVKQRKKLKKIDLVLSLRLKEKIKK